MDPSQTFDPTLIPESSEMLTEEDSQAVSESSHNFSETLIKNLSKLSLNPSTSFPPSLPEGFTQQQDRESSFQDMRDGWPLRKRRGVRTLLSVQRERMARLRYILINKFSPLARRLKDAELKGVQNDYSKPFKCRCSYCVSNNWDPSENARIGNDNTESVSP
uniref:Developmental pluripotency associated 3 n=1 Tax=Otolemur garnettii TaxID=30611 RepID=H0XZ05_OTOGA